MENRTVPKKRIINKWVFASTIAYAAVNLLATGEGVPENAKKLRLLEIKGKMADRIQHRGWYICVVKPAQPESKEVKPFDTDAKEILLANLPDDKQKALGTWQANRSPGPAMKRLDAELAARRADYIAAVSSGTPDQIDAATKNLEATKDQIARLRDLSAADEKDEGILIVARPTGQTYENLEIWDCNSQKELDEAFATALRARKEQDARQAEAKARLKADQELADKNDPDGIFKMAERYYLGDRLAGINRDIPKARALYEKAASMGHADAAIALKHLQSQRQPPQ
jgi:hypothetical protein